MARGAGTIAPIAIKKGPTKGSGGKHRNKLKGYGPTPKAEDRVYHKAYKAKKAAELLGENKMDVSKAQAQFKEFEQAADGLNAYAKQADAKLPMIAADTSSIKRGAVAALGMNYYDMGRQTGKKVVRILKGEKPGSIAVEEGSTTMLELNAKAAREQGATLSAALLKEGKVIVP